ncbi:hypothetical protein K470DRAFT_296640 [Piedraia hortae CBS 480.64]|uniref:PPP4R2-domain-containing protein n=1 Tax=Piedraia hortae CBS 480.64 TaxID=1314780 RepID=A0A6A7BTQ0_9PEZI|nr:hypothetical protein K470DRAFT_296640 [Piedraia hortae CBS 480.64]
MSQLYPRDMADEILTRAATDGSFEISEWPRTLAFILDRLDDIFRHAFPLPKAMPRSMAPPPLPSRVEVPASTPPRAADGDKNDVSPNSDQTRRTSPSKNGENGFSSSNTIPESNCKEDDPPTNSQQENESPPSSERENQAPNVTAGASPFTNGLEFPQDLLELYKTCRQTLERDFAQYPPHTIQRLAELVLHPKQHHRFLPAYLRALDRVVTVTSGAHDFPSQSSDSATHGTNGVSETSNYDENLGGALLTPIPWLRRSGLEPAPSEGELHSERKDTIEGPRGTGSIETVTVTVNGIQSPSNASQSQQLQSNSTPVSPTLSEQSDASSSSSESIDERLRREGGVSQGELLRQEQEVGVVPLSQTLSRRPLAGADVGGIAGGDSVMVDSEVPHDAEDIPHARGPEVIGVADLGPQKSVGPIDLEAAVGRLKSPELDADEKESRTKSNAHGRESTANEEHVKEESTIEKDKDGDIIIADANG